MKFALIIATFVTTVMFANSKDLKENSKKETNYKTTYLRFGSMGMSCEKDYFIAPSACGGWLYRENKQGVDISVNIAGIDDNERDAFSFTAPKIQYLRFFSNNKNSIASGTYFGLGSSFHGVYVNKKEKNEIEEKHKLEKDVSNYTGLAANVSVGYSHKLGKKLQTSAQFAANMPTPLAIKAKGDVYKPSFELNIGLGF
jgi:hypothetical protein